MNPEVVQEADKRLLDNPMNMVSRKMLSGTYFQQLSAQEMALDQELANNLSLKNLYNTSKLAKQQQETI